jgi:hypothetical protein
MNVEVLIEYSETHVRGIIRERESYRPASGRWLIPSHADHSLAIILENEQEVVSIPDLK